jgi:type III secretory pathway component EscU
VRSSIVKRASAWLYGPTLVRDLAIIVAIKFVILMILKYAFFNHPQAENMNMPPAEVAQQMLSVPLSTMSESEGKHHAQ